MEPTFFGAPLEIGRSSKANMLHDLLSWKVLVPCRYKYDVALILDSAAAFFGRDNVGLCGVAHFFKVCTYLHSAHRCSFPICQLLKTAPCNADSLLLMIPVIIVIIRPYTSVHDSFFLVCQLLKACSLQC